MYSSCSHLIIEHETKRKSMPSPSHLVPSKKKQSSRLGSSSQGVEAGFTLGGPATDRDGRSRAAPNVVMGVSDDLQTNIC